MRWLMNNSQFVLAVLFVVSSVVWRVVKAGIEQKQQADARRAGGRPASPGDPAEAVLTPADASVLSRSPSARPDELAAQRQAQIEMWKARQAALGGPMQSPSSPGGSLSEDQLASRRRLAMEELRRRQVEVDQRRSRQTANRPQPVVPAPTSRRRAARTEAERRQAAQNRRNAALAEAGAAAENQSSIIGEVIAATVAHPQPKPIVVPTSRTTPIGALLFSPESLRQAFIMKELLDPPLALRVNSAGFGFGYDQSV